VDLFELAESKAQRDAGMKLAADHAEEVSPGWSEAAYQWLRRYANLHSRFISEHCTSWAAEQGFSSPADPRAWGAVFKRASKEGIIVRVGYGTSLRRHCSPTPLWHSEIYKAAA
jgi:hypothetical protein